MMPTGPVSLQTDQAGGGPLEGSLPNSNSWMLPFVSSDTLPSSINLLVFIAISFNLMDVNGMLAFRKRL
jgi:hypothetical protein